MEFAVLGTLEVRRDGGVCDLGPPKQRALLARLLLDVNRPVSVDRLIDDLWGGAPPGRATASLQAYVSNLRRILEPERAARSAATILVTQPPGYALRVPEEAVDALRFRALAATATERLAAGTAAAAHAAAVEALALWRGPALADVVDEAFAAPEIGRLENLRLSVEEVRLAAALDLGRVAEAVAELETLVVREPLRERFWELLVLALYRSGRSADALERYRRIHQLLDEELGLEPGPALRELEQAVLRQDPALLPAPTPPEAPPGAPVVAAPPAPVVAAGGPAAPRLDAAGRPPLTGRDAELDVLAEVTRAAAAGVTRWTLLTGEAGMGKSRLAEAARDHAVADGWSVTIARCHDDADTPAHWLWAQALRCLPPAAGAIDPSGREPGVYDAFAALTARAREAPGADGARFALYQGIEQALTSAAGERPLLVVLDDLQWADGDSLRALRFLAVQLRDVPVHVLATVRDGEGEPLLHEVLATVERQPGALRIAVPPVGLETVRTIVEAVSGESMDDEVGRRLLERSGGNPFFATELARFAGMTEAGDVPLPVGVRDAVRRRLERLPAEVQAILTLAAVAGRTFDGGVLAPASEQEITDLLELLDPALATGVVLAEDAPLRFRFAHDLLRDALLADLTPTQRQRLHARIAKALQHREGDGDRTLSEVAHHLVEAGPMGDLSAAVDAARGAAQQDLDRFAFDEAARWFDRALGVLAGREAVQGPDPQTRLALLVSRGSTLYRAGRATESRASLIEAVDDAATLGDLETVATAAAALSHTGGVWTWVDLGQLPEEALHRLERALERVGTADSPARARLLSLLSIGRYFGGDADRVEQLSAEAVALARRLAAPDVLADVLLDRSFLLWDRHGCAEAVALADEALRLEGLTELQRAVAHGRRFVALLFLGEVPEAIEAHGLAEVLARDAQLLGPLMQLAHLPVAVATARGRFAEAEALLATSWALHERGDVPVIAEAILSMELVLHRHRSGLAGQLPLLTELPTMLPIRAAHQLLALARLEAGDRYGAEEALAASLAALRIPWMELLADTLEAEIRAGLPPSAEAEALADVLAPHADMIAAAGTTYWWGQVGTALGALEHRLGRLEDAEARLRGCLERTQAWDLRTWTVQVQVLLAAVLDDQGGHGAEAEALREAAATAAAEIGMVLPESPVRRQASPAPDAKSPTG